MDYIKKLKKENNNTSDYIYKTIKLNNHVINLINIETITSSKDINNFILKKLILLNNFTLREIDNYLFNFLPCNSIIRIKNYKELKYYLLNGFTILIIDNLIIFGVETKNNLGRNISNADYESCYRTKRFLC